MNEFSPMDEQNMLGIRKDLLGSAAKQNESINRLLFPFHHFVKDTLKRGDFDTYKKIRAEQNQSVSKDEYMINLAEIFLEPILPVDLENPEKFKPIIEKLAAAYMKRFM